METVLLKAALLMYQKTSDEVTAIGTLCKVSHVWWHVIQNCRVRKRATLQRIIDSEFLTFLCFNWAVFRVCPHCRALY